METMKKPSEAKGEGGFLFYICLRMSIPSRVVSPWKRARL